MNDQKKTLDPEQVLERVRAIVAEVLDIPVTDVASESRFVEDLSADSHDLLSLYLALEDGFDREIPDEAATELTTVRTAVEFVHAHLLADPPHP